MKKIIFLLLLSAANVQAQNRNNLWCFGDSAGIDFSVVNNPIPFHSALKTRGSCVSICDTNSLLLFYAYTRAGLPGNTSLIKNRNHQLMLNGDNVVGRGWYMELVITPGLPNSNTYYLFSAGETTTFGLYYSVIDMTLDSGRGAVTQKNIQLLADPAIDGINAVKHGNGRDWWVLFRIDGYYAGGPTNEFDKFLVSPAGVILDGIQNIGTLISSSNERLIFNKTGEKLAVVAMEGLIETFDFDRCTGLISNHQIIRQLNLSQPSPRLWSGEFSPNGRFLYVGTCSIDTSYLIQIDLQNSQPWMNADTIWANTLYPYSGAMKRGPDDKIYYTTPFYEPGAINYPYIDTTYNAHNMNLSVINLPDSLGLTCDFQPWSFYLGGNRFYIGLPNNPDYDLPRLQGSVCDTVMWTGLTPNPSPMGEGSLTATYITDWQIAFINAQNIKAKNCVLKIYDVNGREVFSSSKKTQPPYFTMDVDCKNFTSGLYLISLITEKEKLSAKFVKE